MQKCAHLVDLEKCCQTHIFLQNFVLIQLRTSPPKKLLNFRKMHFSKMHFWKMAACRPGPAGAGSAWRGARAATCSSYFGLRGNLSPRVLRMKLRVKCIRVDWFWIVYKIREDWLRKRHRSWMRLLHQFRDNDIEHFVDVVDLPCGCKRNWYAFQAAHVFDSSCLCKCVSCIFLWGVWS